MTKKMAIIDQLAASLGRNDEAPNIELAERIASRKDAAAVAELAALLRHKSKEIQSDAVKTLYETGERAPELITPHVEVFLELLESKNNRLVWGAMTALDAIASRAPGLIQQHLGRIMAAADRGSVIAKDHAVGILIKLAAQPAFRKDALVLLFDLMKSCASNQFPMYAENALPVISTEFNPEFTAVLRSRLDDFEQESKRKRVEKVLKKLGV